MGGLSSTLRQRMQALDRANLIRVHAAEVKRQLKDRRLGVEDALGDELLQGLPVYEVLEAAAGLSPRKVGVLLLHARIGYARPIRNLTRRDRAVIFDYICMYHRRVLLRSPRSLGVFAANEHSEGRERAIPSGKVQPTHKNGAAPPQRPAPGHKEIESL